MNPDRILQLRMERQHLLAPAAGDEYDELFRTMSPVHTLYWTEPGAPPVLYRRAAFDDLAYNDRRRASRQILKGRYQNGSVGYVDNRDLELYASAYRKDIPSLNFEELALLELLTQEGPLTIGGIKDITGLKVKNITPVLHKLQQAFLVFEDQIDSEWDRAWYTFASEFSDVDTHKYDRADAIAQIVRRFLPLAVCVEANAVKSFYSFTAKDTRLALDTLRETGFAKEIVINGKPHYFRREDAETLSMPKADVLPGVFLLHRSDFWVKSEEYALKKRFVYDGVGADVLYYIVVDSAIRGAVFGRFKFGPHVIEDVRTDLDETQKKARGNEILRAVYDVFDPETSPAARYEGTPTVDGYV